MKAELGALDINLSQLSPLSGVAVPACQSISLADEAVLKDLFLRYCGVYPEGNP
jgi:hypothetical protein